MSNVHEPSLEHQAEAYLLKELKEGQRMELGGDKKLRRILAAEAAEHDHRPVHRVFEDTIAGLRDLMQRKKQRQEFIPSGSGVPTRSQFVERGQFVNLKPKNRVAAKSFKAAGRKRAA